MRYSRSYIFTLKENPRDAEITSHQLMLRSGMIRKSAAGLYTWMPLGKRVLDKTIRIVKQEMDRVGALEILPPFVTHGELWKTSGRWDTMGKEMLRFQDRHNQDYVLGPTHEEAFTQIIKETAQSYQDLPVTLYQINTKFRDEIRPRYGVIRCREFIMKDAYSFDVDEEGLDKSYQAMREAYLAVFKNLGLAADPVMADSGNMGGSGSEEFMVPSSVGEEYIVKCTCGYVANVEKATSIFSSRDLKSETALELVDTPGVKTIEQLAQFFQCETKDLVKSFVVEADGRLVMACIRGDLQINETKLKNILQVSELVPADPAVIFKQLNAPIGFLGPIGVSIEVIADESIIGMNNTIIGANRENMHYSGVSIDRDCKFSKTASFHLAEEGHTCSQCGHLLNVYKGIEVGHIFKLGRKYTESMGIRVLDSVNKDIVPTCGCYGIGVGRAIAAVIEQNADENGIIFPISMAPYHIIITPTSVEGDIWETAEKLYQILQNKGCEVLLDDRNERPGIKFKDAELLGIPIRITIGRSWQEKQQLEIKVRRTSEVYTVSWDEVGNCVQQLIQKEFEVLK
ncbi:MAG: proline--tRNA ligase [Brevinemataceae bacterium]